MVLGFPVDGDVNSFLTTAIKEAGNSITNLRHLQHKQGELIILRAAGPYTRVSHLIRGVDDECWSADLFEEIDSYTLKELERILGTPIPFAAETRVLQPISIGGVGLPSAVDETRRNRLVQRAKISICEKVRLLKGFEFINEAPLTASVLVEQPPVIRQVSRHMTRSRGRFTLPRVILTVAHF